MSMIIENLANVMQALNDACEEFGRTPSEVALLAVSKTFPEAAVRQAYEAGQRRFGENYVQEGVSKIKALADLPGLEWHLIGPIQSNKTRQVAEYFDWVHSIERLRTAQRLSDQRPSNLCDLQVCLQVNIDGGANKSGCSPDEALVLAQQIACLPRLRLRGLMVIPEPGVDFSGGGALTQARHLFQSVAAAIPGLDTLSMGMSADFRAAVKEGSTMIRVGTAIFGSR